MVAEHFPNGNRCRAGHCEHVNAPMNHHHWITASESDRRTLKCSRLELRVLFSPAAIWPDWVRPIRQFGWYNSDVLFRCGCCSPDCNLQRSCCIHFAFTSVFTFDARLLIQILIHLDASLRTRLWMLQFPALIASAQTTSGFVFESVAGRYAKKLLGLLGTLYWVRNSIGFAIGFLVSFVICLVIKLLSSPLGSPLGSLLGAVQSNAHANWTATARTALE